MVYYPHWGVLYPPDLILHEEQIKIQWGEHQCEFLAIIKLIGARLLVVTLNYQYCYYFYVVTCFLSPHTTLFTNANISYRHLTKTYGNLYRRLLNLQPTMWHTLTMYPSLPQGHWISYKWTIVRWSAWDVPTVNFLTSTSGIVAEELLSIYDTTRRRILDHWAQYKWLYPNEGHGNGGRYESHRTKLNYYMHSSSSLMFRLSHNEKWSGEPSWICWASVCFSK